MTANYVASTSNKFFPRTYGSIPERFWAKVSPEPNTGCWLWCGDDNGHYGNLGTYDKNTKRSSRLLAHRVSYEIHYGPIPEGLEIDHDCQQKLCVNPEHLKLLTHRQNVKKIPAGIRGNNQIKTHCSKGHALNGNNLRFDSRGHAVCRECGRRYGREARERNRHAG